MKTHTHHVASGGIRLMTLLIPILGLFCFEAPSRAIEPTIRKVVSGSSFQTDPRFGRRVALNDKWFVVGEPQFDGELVGQDDFGLVHVFDARTGKKVRTLTALTPTVNDRFGESLALCGDSIVIGAPNSTFGGAFYIFDLRNGALVAFSTVGVPSDNFGVAVAAAGNIAAVGANGDSGNRGRVYLFSLTTGAALGNFTASDVASGDGFGSSLSMDGGLLLAGSPGDDTARGSAYLFSAEGGEIVKFTASDGATGDLFGSAVALNGRNALVGAPFKTGGFGALQGSAYLFNTRSFFEEFRLAPHNGFGGDAFGISVALQDNVALVGAPGAPLGSQRGFLHVFDLNAEPDFTGVMPPIGMLEAHDGNDGDQFGSSAAISGNRVGVGAPIARPPTKLANHGEGAAYLFDGFAGPANADLLLTTGDASPDIPGASLSKFGDACISPFSEIAACASLGSVSRSQNKAIFAKMQPDPFEVAQQSGTPALGVLAVKKVSNPNFNNLGYLMFDGVFVPPGGAARLGVFTYEGMTSQPVLAIGDTPGPLFGIQLSKFVQRVHSIQLGAKRWCQVFNAKRGVAGVGAGNDSGLMILDEFGTIQEAVVEGDLVPAAIMGETVGQISRASYTGTQVVYTAPFGNSATATNQAVLKREPTFGEDIVARKGVTLVPGTLGDTYSAFLGETASNAADSTVFRATLNLGGLVSRKSNEGIYSEHFAGGLGKVARKGENDPNVHTAGVFWSRFLNFWGISPQAPGQVLFTAKLGGTGVSARNDCGLYLLQENGIVFELLREGDPAPGCGAAKIGSFQRVVADPLSGNYAVLVSLTGAPRNANQALLIGNTVAGTVVQSAIRRPWLALRKGQAVQGAFGQTAGIASIGLPGNSFDKSGAGGKGLMQPVNIQSTLASVWTSNRRVSLSIVNY